MKQHSRPPSQSLRDLTFKDLRNEKNLLIWNNDPSYANEMLATVLDCEAYILDDSAKEYLGELAEGLSIEDYFRSIANLRMPFQTVWIETDYDNEHEDDNIITMGALIRDTPQGINVFRVFTLRGDSPRPYYSGAEVLFHRNGEVSCSKTPIASFYERMGGASGYGVEDQLNDDINACVRLGGLFAVMCAVLERPHVLDRETAHAPRKSIIRSHERMAQKAPRFAVSVIRLSRAKREQEAAAKREATQGVTGTRSAHWVRGHVFLARNGKLTWRRDHVRGTGDSMQRVNRVTK